MYAIVDCGVSDEALLADISKHDPSFYGIFLCPLSIYFLYFRNVLKCTFVHEDISKATVSSSSIDKAIHFMLSDIYDQRCIVYGNKMIRNI